MAEQYHLLRPKCDRILLLHDNARRQTALKTWHQLTIICSILSKTTFVEKCSTAEATSISTWMTSPAANPRSCTREASSSCPRVVDHNGEYIDY
uniref:Uncharacterized protein n=1 Tax=Caenorhabditis tropicalis TaxID=1561998 RepID=A0A1I7T7W4_9PELO